MKKITLWMLTGVIAAFTMFCTGGTAPPTPIIQSTWGDTTTATKHSPPAEGQVCSNCHNDSNQVRFSIAGTIYTAVGSATPLTGSTTEAIKVYSDAGQTNLIATVQIDNAGNFYSTDPDITTPYYVQVGSTVRKMIGAIDTTTKTSCNSCHAPAGSQGSFGP